MRRHDGLDNLFADRPREARAQHGLRHFPRTKARDARQLLIFLQHGAEALRHFLGGHFDFYFAGALGVQSGLDVGMLVRFVSVRFGVVFSGFGLRCCGGSEFSGFC